MNARNVLLWLHIVVAMVTMGPLIMFDVAGPIAVRNRNVAGIRFVEGVAQRVGPATLLIPILGLAMVAEGGYEIGDRWIIASLVVYAALLGVGLGVLMPAMAGAVAKVESGQEPTAELTRLKIFGAVNITLFLVILWLMVAKPGL